MALVSAVLVLVFGAATLIMHDERFIQWKVSVIVLAVRAWRSWRAIVRRSAADRSGCMGEQRDARACPSGCELSWAWVVCYVALGALNLYVAYNSAESTWVNFKLSARSGSPSCSRWRRVFWLASKMQPEGQ